LDFQERQAAILKSNPLPIDWERAVRLVPGVLPHTFVAAALDANIRVLTAVRVPYTEGWAAFHGWPAAGSGA
jgi:hypothetical protein